MMRQQVNLKFEAFALHRFSQNFEATAKAWGHRPRIAFPRPIYPWVARGCLVEELVADAVPIAAVLGVAGECGGGGGGGGGGGERGENGISPHALAPANLARLRADLAVLGLRGFLQMLLWDNFVHADLHPGNILVTFVRDPRRRAGPPRGLLAELLDSVPGRLGNLAASVRRLAVGAVTPGPLPGDPCRPMRAQRRAGEGAGAFIARQLRDERVYAQIVFLDTGLVTELARRDFANFTDLFEALVVRGDGYRAGELMIDRSAARAGVRDREGFCRGLAELVRPVFARRAALVSGGSAASLKELRLDVVLQGLFQLARVHHVRIDSAYTNLVMSLLCVEGLGRQLAPEMDLRPLLAQAALQYLVRW
jgi:aarF domain-containing kinase